MLSGRGLCDELITRPEESYRLWCVVVYDLETSRIGAPYIDDISNLRVKGIAAVWYSHEKMAVVIRERLRKKALYIHRGGIFKLVPTMVKIQQCNPSTMLKKY